MLDDTDCYDDGHDSYLPSTQLWNVEAIKSRSFIDEKFYRKLFIKKKVVLSDNLILCDLEATRDFNLQDI
jgi:hypothetical protein